ncbi:MAG: CDP-diacylglycerol--glycerol-3-phosphate 3-phosphatidyltransferase [Alphaproteobacteria bacterium]|nr:CDP-diacylglycerol--glycerol-3-phosphate 3-phosphatidyltransferase [Alphaproteobacteria bacterium]
MRHLPNVMTVLRIIASTAVPFLIMSDLPGLRYLAVGLFAAAALTDWLDGYLARRMNAVSNLGRMLDPVADKLLVAGSLLALAAFENWGWLMFIPALMILLREVFISGLREFMSAYNLVIHVTFLAKIKTPIQLIAIGFVMSTPLTPLSWRIADIALALMWLAAILTAITGWDYLKKALAHDLSAQQ